MTTTTGTTTTMAMTQAWRAAIAFFAATATSASMAAAATVVPSPASQAPAPAASAPRVRVAIVRTARRVTREAMLFSGGRFLADATVNFSAVVVEHGDERLLFDTGLGRRIDAQYAADMPRWMRPFFGYDAPVDPVRDQLERAHVPPPALVVLSHAHWDHASGLADFPEAEVALASEELAFVRAAERHAGSPWPSQVGLASIRWKPLDLAANPRPFEGFDRSLDLYGDGSAVLVAMPGHTPGSMGLFVRVASGRRLFFVGDTVWNAGALAEGRPKFGPARWIVDGDAPGTRDAIERIRAARRRDPRLVVVPAHDGAVQDALGLFPKWIE